jgi:hypothetical protein
LTGLAVVSFVLACVWLAIGAFVKDAVPNPTSRACLLCLVALALTTFAWVFYPHAVRANEVKVPFLGWQLIGFGGPLLLLLATLAVLFQLFPQPAPPQTRFYALECEGDPPPTPTLRYNGKTSHPRLIPVHDPVSRHDRPIGFLAVFDSPDPFPVKLSDEYNRFAEASVTCEPGERNGVIKLSRK